jgi:hypothetical protein
MKPLNIALAILPVLIVAIGLIGWVVTLRGNLDSALKDIAELKLSYYDDTILLEQIQELYLVSEESMTKISWIQEEYGPAIEDIRNRELDTDIKDRIAQLDKEVGAIGSVLDRAQELDEIVDDIEKRQAVVENEMRTIMSDHAGFADVLRELELSGVLPSGERRVYGGYSNN